MVERDGLENRCTRKGTVGSNPTLSAIVPALASFVVAVLRPAPSPGWGNSAATEFVLEPEPAAPR